MKIDTVVVGPSDRVIVTTDIHLTNDQRTRVQAYLVEHLGTDRVALLDGGISLTVLREAA